MIRDALILSDSKYHFKEAIYDPKMYYKLNDTIIFQIEHSVEPVRVLG